MAIEKIPFLVTRDMDTNELSQPTTTKDDADKDVLRIVDSAPFAYNEENEALQTLIIPNQMRVFENIERYIGTQTTIYDGIYFYGSSLKPLENGNTAGNFTVTFGINDLTLALNNNPSNVARASVVTTNVVDVGSYSYWYLDFEFNNDTIYTPKIYLIVGGSKTGEYSEYLKRFEIVASSGADLSRRTMKFDIRDMVTTKYVKVFLVDESASVSINCQLKIHRMWFEK